MNEVISHTYRMQLRVPRVVPRHSGETVWRHFAGPVSYGEVTDAAEHLRDSLLAAGFETAKVDAWFANYVRAEEYRTVTEQNGAIPLTGRS